MKLTVDRVHEEYREITTRPIAKIIAPIRNTPFFSKATKVEAFVDQGTELRPLTAQDVIPQQQSVSEVPAGRSGSLLSG